MEMEAGGVAIARRRLMLRDALSVLVIVLVTAGLFVVTLFLFRSFSARRAELAQRWSQRGRLALAGNKPEEAIADLRTALSYAPGTRAYELLLAEALGQAGRTDESYNYFLGLWETAPGSGDINLSLARLAARRNDRSEAVNHYRAAIYGTWEGDGVQRRAAVRTELAGYLIGQQDLGDARLELLIAAGNTPDDYDRDLRLGRLFEAAQDATDAEAYYLKAVAARPDEPAALEAAGRLAYRMADYETAHRLLSHAEELRARQDSADAAADGELARNAARLLELDPAATLPPPQRIARILFLRSVARKRFDGCTVEAAHAALPGLSARWSGPDATSKAATLLRDPARQDAALQLAFDTEKQTEPICGAPSGDDALLLRLASSVRRGGDAR